MLLFGPSVPLCRQPVGPTEMENGEIRNMEYGALRYPCTGRQYKSDAATSYSTTTVHPYIITWYLEAGEEARQVLASLRRADSKLSKAT